MFRRRIRREQAMASLDLAGRRVDYLLKRSSARRSLSLRVNAQGQAQVNAPLAMPLPRIEAFLARHVAWLQAQLVPRPAEAAWADGAKLPYLGGELSLALAPAAGAGPVWLEGARLVCAAAEVADAVTAWYRRQAGQVLAERLAAVCGHLGLALPPWRLSNARTRWGSLSAKGVVGLNWRLVKASQAEIDYVICHELAHIRQRNHSPAYWREVARLCPDYQTARVQLRTGSARYMAF
ncbi:MAG: SprT family zinc-dependent metalloprotease [Gallionellaceae bacterium]|nr:SprT family zinc-dependent metalloprotease [Gallionellaceae bacterium]